MMPEEAPIKKQRSISMIKIMTRVFGIVLIGGLASQVAGMGALLRLLHLRASGEDSAAESPSDGAAALHTSPALPPSPALSVVDREELLRTQDYATLAAELYKGLDSKEPTLRFETHRWVTEQLERGLNPFLLYMDARTVCESNPVDYRAYAPAFKHLILCIVLTEVAQAICAAFGIESTPGAGIPDLATAMKVKFYAKYGGSTLNKHIRGHVDFKKIKAEAITLLQALNENDESIAALPLPHWVTRTSCGWALGWGMTWATLTAAELKVRENEVWMPAFVAQTKKALTERIAALEGLETWEAFFGVEGEGTAASEQ